jgi:hypothetical protein
MNWCPTALTRDREDFALGNHPLLTVILLRSPPRPHGRLPWSMELVIAPGSCMFFLVRPDTRMAVFMSGRDLQGPRLPARPATTESPVGFPAFQAETL